MECAPAPPRLRRNQQKRAPALPTAQRGPHPKERGTQPLFLSRALTSPAQATCAVGKAVCP